MKIFDITRPIFPNMLVYPGDVHPTFHQEDRGQYLISSLHLSTHTGTHVDAPSHYIKQGATIDTVPLTHLIGPCRVIDLSDEGTVITASHLKAHMEGVNRFILKTTFSGTDRYVDDFPALTPDAAREIAAREMKCVGIDAPSIESCHGDGTVHRTLLSCNCIIIELLDLSHIEDGDYEMVALPLRLEKMDGSPARVVLIKKDED